MKRVEIVINYALETDLLDAFRENGVGTKYTSVSNVTGRGESDPKMGDAVWPQVNSIFVIVCEEPELEVLKKIILDLRNLYPKDGIAMFISDCEVF